MTDLSVYVRSTHQRIRARLQARSLWHNNPLRQYRVACIDAILICIIVGVAVAGRFGIDVLATGRAEIFPWEIALIITSWPAFIAIVGGYSLAHLQTGLDEYARVAVGSGMLAGTMAIVCYLADVDLSRGFFVLLFVVGVPVLLIGRFIRRQLLNHLRTRGLMQSQVIVAGAPTHIDEIAKVLRREKWLGYHVVGALTPNMAECTPDGLPVLGRVCDVASIVADKDLYAVVFTEGAFPSSADFRRMAWELENRNIEMIVVPAITDISAERVTPRPVAGLPLVYIDRPRAQQAGRWVKRAFDIVGSSLLLLAAAPVLALVALAIKLEDGGPILFRQTRVGHGGKHFSCLKIRSMVVDAEARKAALQAMNEGAGPLFKMARDPRITRVGQFIRRFSIDEVPQFWNVLVGEMSLVGPRPALPSEVSCYDRDATRRLDVRPGLTGLWQVSGRSNLSWEDTVRLDLYYVDNWSLVRDLSILARTAKAVFGSAGAY